LFLFKTLKMYSIHRMKDSYCVSPGFFMGSNFSCCRGEFFSDRGDWAWVL
jgi:hypothetical protein